MSDFRVDSQGFLIDATGTRVGFKETDGDEVFFARLNSAQDGILKADGTALPLVAGGASFSSLSGNPTDNTSLAASLAAKVPTTRTVNGQALSGDVSVTYTNIGGVVGDNASLAAALAAKVATTRQVNGSPLSSDVTVSFTNLGGVAADNASLVTALAAKVATSRTVNGQALSGDVTVSFTNLGGAATDNASLVTALAAKVATSRTINGNALTSDVTLDRDDIGVLSTGTNEFGVQTMVIPSETPQAAGTTTAGPICDGFQTIASDDDCSGNTHQEWGGLQRGIFTRMGDNTLFCTYIQNNAGTDRLRIMRSPTGGGLGAWTQVDTIATTCYKSVQMRCRTRDQLIILTCEGTSPNLILKLRVYSSAGVQVGSTYSINAAGKGFAQTLTSSGFYYEAGISQVTDSAGRTRVVLGGWTLPLPVSIQNNTTMCCYKQVQWLFWDGSNWTQEGVERFDTGVRMDYDNMIVGADGDPDMVYGIYQGNVAMWESVGQFTPERLQPFRLSPIAAYAFDRFGVWWHNRRTGHFDYKETSPTMTWAIRPWDGDGSSFNASNDIPEARTRQAMFNYVTGEWWIVYKCIRPVPYTAGLTCTGTITKDVMNVTAISGTTNIKIGTNVISHSLATTGFLASKVIGMATTAGATDSSDVAMTGSGGTGTYLLDTPQTLGSGTIGLCSGKNPSTTNAPTTTWRLQITTLKGKVKWDGELCSEGFGLMGLTQVASGRVYCMFLARAADNQQTYCHLFELTRQADGEVNTVSRTLANSYNITNNPLSGNVGFGTWATYLTGAQTLPARCSNQGPIFPDWQHGSKPTTNTLDILIARRATDHNGSGTLTTASYDTASKMDHMKMRVPA